MEESPFWSCDMRQVAHYVTRPSPIRLSLIFQPLFIKTLKSLSLFLLLNYSLSLFYIGYLRTNYLEHDHCSIQGRIKMFWGPTLNMLRGPPFLWSPSVYVPSPPLHFPSFPSLHKTSKGERCKLTQWGQRIYSILQANSSILVMHHCR